MFDNEGVATEVLANFITTGFRVAFQMMQPYAKNLGATLWRKVKADIACAWGGGSGWQEQPCSRFSAWSRDRSAWRRFAADMLVVHQFWIDGYKDFNFMRASAVVKRQSTFMAS